MFGMENEMDLMNFQIKQHKIVEEQEIAEAGHKEHGHVRNSDLRLKSSFIL